MDAQPVVIFDWSRMAAAAVVPVVVVSACALLCLALYNRLAVVVGRLRGFERERIEAATTLARLRVHESPLAADVLRQEKVLANLAQQAAAVTRRGHLVQWAIGLLMSAICSLMLTSLCSGLGTLFHSLTYVAAGMFIVGVLLMLAGVIEALRELQMALDPILLEMQAIDELEEALAQGLPAEGSGEATPTSS